MATFWFYKSGKLEASRKGFYFQGTLICNKLRTLFSVYKLVNDYKTVLAQD